MTGILACMPRWPMVVEGSEPIDLLKAHSDV